MSEDNAKMPAGEPEEEMSVELELEDGTLVNCAVITILDVAEKSYIVPVSYTHLTLPTICSV